MILPVANRLLTHPRYKRGRDGEISSKGGADGIERLFLENVDNIPGLDMIKVDHIVQKTIITN